MHSIVIYCVVIIQPEIITVLLEDHDSYHTSAQFPSGCHSSSHLSPLISH